jgi:hypothetical protein
MLRDKSNWFGALTKNQKPKTTKRKKNLKHKHGFKNKNATQSNNNND